MTCAGWRWPTSARRIGTVLQETFLFSVSIAENIAYGRKGASREEIEAAARAARAHDFISALSDGYDTKLGERGVNLSGGQKQRLAIARALLLNPRILILDDATSSVDSETEHHIQQALQTLMEGRTSFVIAQRLTTVKEADQILVLQTVGSSSAAPTSNSSRTAASTPRSTTFNCATRKTSCATRWRETTESVVGSP
jgi:ABC-type multidrug transport system fused ATPase/permease subunit